MNDYKNIYSFEQKILDSNRILEKFPNKIPIIVNRYSNNMPDIDKKKFLVPKHITVSEFMVILRKRINITSDKAFYILVNNNSLQINETMGFLLSENIRKKKKLNLQCNFNLN